MEMWSCFSHQCYQLVAAISEVRVHVHARTCTMYLGVSVCYRGVHNIHVCPVCLCVQLVKRYNGHYVILVAGIHRVAQKLGVSYAPAMMGWDFHSGHCVPV